MGPVSLGSRAAADVYVEVADVRLYARSSSAAGPQGSGRVVLLMVHGFSQDHRLFDPQVPGFAGRFDVVAPDLRGHGRSGAPGGGYHVGQYAADTVAVLDAVGAERVVLWGSHTGAAVGLVLALEQPERIVALVLESPVVPGVPMRVVAEALDRVRATCRTRGLAAAKRAWFDRSPWFDGIRAHPEARRATAHLAMIEAFSGEPWQLDSPVPPVDVSHRLGDVRCPVLVVNGEHDVAEFRSVAVRVVAEVPSAEQVLVADAGGFAGWEQPAAVNAAVVRFLGRGGSLA